MASPIYKKDSKIGGKIREIVKNLALFIIRIKLSKIQLSGGIRGIFDFNYRLLIARFIENYRKLGGFVERMIAK
jgi:hypothetical protein